jgi:hypothetical protein
MPRPVSIAGAARAHHDVSLARSPFAAADVFFLLFFSLDWCGDQCRGQVAWGGRAGAEKHAKEGVYGSEHALERRVLGLAKLALYKAGR